MRLKIASDVERTTIARPYVHMTGEAKALKFLATDGINQAYIFVEHCGDDEEENDYASMLTKDSEIVLWGAKMIEHGKQLKFNI